jgi:hypothetical protein
MAREIIDPKILLPIQKCKKKDLKKGQNNCTLMFQIAWRN